MSSDYSKAPRIPYIDGIRGYLIISLTISHISAILGNNLFGYISHKTFSLFFTGEGFMFISGLMIGYIYCKPVESMGLNYCIKLSLKRSLKILYYYIAVYVFSAIPILIFGLENSPVVSDLFKERNPFTTQSFVLFLSSVYRPAFFDILSLYIILIATSPIIVHLYQKGKAAILIGASFLMWSSVQYGITEKVILLIEKKYSFDPSILGSFNILAWQLPFFIGIIIGINAYKKPSTFIWLAKITRGKALKSIIAILLVFFLYRMLIQFNIIRMGYDVLVDYLKLDIMTLINFFCFGITLFCILSSENNEQNKYIRTAKKITAYILNTSLLTVIGKNTLLTFSLSVIISYWIASIKPLFTIDNFASASLIILVVIVILFLLTNIKNSISKRLKH